MAERFVSNARLIDEIKRSKASYCYFNTGAKSYDAIASTFDDISAYPVGMIVRLETWDHIPLAVKPNARLQGKAKVRERLSFAPFKHYRLTAAGPIEVARSHWLGDLDTGQFSTTHGKLTDKLGIMLISMVESISMKGNFRQYSYREEMVGDALTALCANALRYDETKDTSAFAYLTTITTNEMIKRLKREKLSQSLRDDLLEDANGMPSIARQMEGDLARFEPVKLVRTKRRARYIEPPATFLLFTGRVRATITFASAATAISASPPTAMRTATARGAITVRAQIVGRTKELRVIHAARPKGPRPKRSVEAIAGASSKLRAQREARVTAVLPLMDEARANGCQLLREICAYLDKIGHRPPQGEHWAVPTLSQILPRPTDEDREARDAAFEALINEAQAGGITNHREISDWLNLRACRTARGGKWSRPNVAKFLRERKALRSAAKDITD